MSTGTTLGVAGLVIGVVGIAIAIYTYLKSQKIRRPCWYSSTSVLLRPDDAVNRDLVVRFRDQSVRDLSVTALTLYNRGNEAIGYDNVSSHSPLAITAEPPAQILRAFVSSTTRPDGEVDLIPDLGENGNITRVRIGFEYLNPRDQIRVTVIHTGIRSNAISAIGDVRDSAPLRYAYPPEPILTGSRTNKVTTIFVLLGVFVLFVSPLLNYVGVPQEFRLLPLALILIVFLWIDFRRSRR